MKRGGRGSEVQPVLRYNSASVDSGQKESKQEHLSPGDLVLGDTDANSVRVMRGQLWD